MSNNHCLINLIIALILSIFIICNSSYATEKELKSESKIQVAYDENINQFYNSIDCFKTGIKDCIDLVFPLSFSLVIIIILAEQNLISHSSIKAIPLFNICVDNFMNFIFFSFILPLFENILSHSIGYTMVEKLLHTIIPNNFSNERLNKKISKLKDYNIPLMNEKIHKLCAKIDTETKSKPQETSMTVEILSKLILAYSYLKIYSFNQQIVSGIIKAKYAIYRTDHYKSKGYHGAVMYQSGFTSCLYLCIAIILIGANFINS